MHKNYKITIIQIPHIGRKKKEKVRIKTDTPKLREFVMTMSPKHTDVTQHKDNKSQDIHEKGKPQRES